MAWLLTHMWVALSGVAVLGILFGWSLRGSLLVGKMRKALVERDVSETELEQAREEIEKLYAAQRSAGFSNAEAAKRQFEVDLKTRDQTIAQLTADLDRTRAEFDALKERASKPVIGAATLSAALEKDEASLIWRNRHLESRVRHLEGLLEEAEQAPAAIVPAAASVPESNEPQADEAEADEATPIAAEAGVSETESGPVDEKEEWTVSYLRNRVEALENELAKTTIRPEQTPARNDFEEELARLRWRNRFLEGRLAYFEAPAEAGGDEPSGIEPKSETEEAAVAEPELAPMDTEPEPEMTAPSEDEPEPEMGAPVDTSAEAEQELSEPVEFVDAEPEFEVVEEPIVEEETTLEDEPFDDDMLIGAPREDSPAALAAMFRAPDVDAVEEEEAETELETATPAFDEAPSNVFPLNGAHDAEEVVDDEEELEADEPVVAPGVRPLAMDKPVENQPDDLTVIGGIGPKIQEVLNELGIWHYDQIAAWSPDNVAWIDHELNFNGRIVREGWVEQAAILAGEPAEVTSDADA